MNKTYHSLSELDESINERILAIKRMIEYLRKDENKAFKSVRQFPLKNIFDDCRVIPDLNYRTSLTKALKEIGFLEIEGRLAGMRYRLKENDFKKDSLAAATEINEIMNNNHKSRKKKIDHPKLLQDSRIINRDLSSKPILIKKEFSLGESVYLLKDNKITIGKIIALKYETASKTSEDYPRIQLPTSVDFNSIVCNILLSDESIHTISTHHIFSDIDILLKSLQVRFFKS
jgi:hypothetical protein